MGQVAGRDGRRPRRGLDSRRAHRVLGQRTPTPHLVPQFIRPRPGWRVVDDRMGQVDCCRPSPIWRLEVPCRLEGAPRPAADPRPHRSVVRRPRRRRFATAPPTEGRARRETERWYEARKASGCTVRRLADWSTATGVGRPIGATRPPPSWTTAAARDGPARSGTVPPGLGRLTRRRAAQRAVAVNGRIGGESGCSPSARRAGGQVRRDHPDFLESGDAGQLQLYVVDRSGGQPRLQPVSLSAE